MNTQTTTRSTVAVTDDAICITVALPTQTPATGTASTSGAVRANDAALLSFATKADCFAGLMMWHRYAAIHELLSRRLDEAAQDPTSDVYGRVFDPISKVAASYATITGVRQCTAEYFVERAVACMDRIPAVGRLMRDGLITPAWFARAVQQTALVEDLALLALIDAEIAYRLPQLGGLSADRVEAIIAAVVAEHDPDAVTLTRVEVEACKKVQVNPLNDSMSELIVTATAEDVRLAKQSLDAVIASVCAHDPRTKQARRSDAAMARLTGVPFTCQCGEEDCDARLSEEEIAARTTRVVVHVIAREETLDGSGTTPAVMDGVGPITPEHAREIAARPDAVSRKVKVSELLDHQAQPGNNYRPTVTLDVLMRALFGTCTTAGCNEPAFACDLDHVTEYNHDDPAAGGPTCVCNLNPKCRFHHQLKTHVEGWIDDQIVDANGVIWTEITTPEGLTVRKQALNTWLLPELGLIPCGHSTPGTACATRPNSGHAENEPRRPKTRTQAKHDYRMARRSANRRAREAAEAELARAEAAGGPPPF